MSNKQVDNAVPEGTVQTVINEAVTNVSQLRKQIRELTQQRDSAQAQVEDLQKRVEDFKLLERQREEAISRTDHTITMLRRDMGLIMEIAKSNTRVTFGLNAYQVDNL